MAEFRRSPLVFIAWAWGLEPQPLVCEKPHRHAVECYGPFVMGTHVTWQQAQVLEAIGSGARRVTIAAGHGVGKSALFAWLIHWHLFTHLDAQIGCTAPTADQMYDVLWKELAVWHRRLPAELQGLYQWSTSHFKIAERPETWWARARTASRERPEAFAGLHGKHVMLLADEAPGVPDEIYRTGEGSLTDADTIVVLAGNPRLLEGYFYETHHRDRDAWTQFSFSAIDSPRVEPDFATRIAAKFGADSDEYRFMVQGLFPREGGIEEGGWMPLLERGDLRFTAAAGRFTKPKLGVDPSGQGENQTVHVVRDAFRAAVVSEEGTSTQKGIAERTLTLMAHYGIPESSVVVDSFGVGANVAVEVAVVSGKRVNAVNVGEEPDDRSRFLNRRAENYWRLREWVLAGGELVRHDGWEELLTIRYKRTLAGKIQVMPKAEMLLRRGYRSPDHADALMLSFDGESTRASASSDVQALTAAQVARETDLY